MRFIPVLVAFKVDLVLLRLTRSVSIEVMAVPKKLLSLFLIPVFKLFLRSESRCIEVLFYLKEKALWLSAAFARREIDFLFNFDLVVGFTIPISLVDGVSFLTRLVLCSLETTFTTFF